MSTPLQQLNALQQSILKDDQSLSSWCGIPSLSSFEKLLAIISDTTSATNSNLKGSPRTRLIHLRQNISFVPLSSLFHMSAGYANFLFQKTRKQLDQQLVPLFIRPLDRKSELPLHIPNDIKASLF